MNKKCKYCLKIFHISPSRDRIKFCSAECRRLGRINPICKNGHNKDLLGRNERSCNECRRIADRKTRQFCSRNHDTFITGRDKNNRCIACADFPGKQICVNGHDTFVTGRDKKGHCKICIRLYRRHHERIRRKTDLNFRIAKTLRGRLKAALKENWKTGSAVKDLGCSMDFLVAYLQEQFYGDMTWDNWGTYWEIDHIKELADFDLSKRRQLLKAVNYTNLRPLAKPDHWKKSAQAKRDRKKRKNKS